MILSERIYLYDFIEKANIRYISFTGMERRFDLAIILTDQFFRKLLILDMQSNCFGIIGEDDLEEEGFLEQTFKLNENEANELRDFLFEIT